MCQNPEILAFFDGQEWALPLYGAVYGAVGGLGPFTVRVSKTQITLCTKYGFAFVWLPPHPVKGRPEQYVVLSFGLNREIKNPRIVEAVMPVKNRWTHHMLLQSPADVDEELAGWLGLAYAFSQRRADDGKKL